MGLLAWIAVGFVVGVIARMLVPTGRHLGCLGTIVVGMVGSVIGGALTSLAGGDGVELVRSGWIGSIIGAVVLLTVVRLLDTG